MLVYDEYEFAESILSEDVRTIFDERPATANIFVLAPFEDEKRLTKLIEEGVAVRRARPYFAGIDGKVRLLSLRLIDEIAHVTAIPFEYVGDSCEAGACETIDLQLINGWLFDLFHRGGGLVEAPIGVHFGKLSGRHTNKFLRTSGPLLTSEACAVVAFFTLGSLTGKPPSRVFVDTAPLISIAFAMSRIAIVHKIWTSYPPVKSFSSYGGVENLPRRKPSDLYIISASTSGGLARRLLENLIPETAIITLFYLESGLAAYDGKVVCHLTYKRDGLHGYSPVSNFLERDCPFCRDGYFLAQLEGDQFMLERRATKRLVIRTQSQSDDARKTAERLARTGSLVASLYNQSGDTTSIQVNGERLLNIDVQLRADFIRMLRRFTPTPLNYVVLVNISRRGFTDLANEAGMASALGNAMIVPAVDTINGSRQALPSVQNGAALVVFGSLSKHAQAREINARMRTLVPGGSVAYLSAITIAESPKALTELEMFLGYGEYGKDTFTYRSAMQFMLPATRAQKTIWEAELNLLSRIRANKPLVPELESRFNELGQSGETSDRLFFSGDRPRLEIANDFVYLDTGEGKENISQADIYAVVENLLACSRVNNNALGSKQKKDGVSVWVTSVYAHLLVCPSNFQIYNDAILRASLLRAATASELLYSTDENCSSEMLNIILSELEAWPLGGGASLPEFLLALATGHLRLVTIHRDELITRLKSYQLPQYMIDLVGEIMSPTVTDS